MEGTRIRVETPIQAMMDSTLDYLLRSSRMIPNACIAIGLIPFMTIFGDRVRATIISSGGFISWTLPSAAMHEEVDPVLPYHRTSGLLYIHWENLVNLCREHCVELSYNARIMVESQSNTMVAEIMPTALIYGVPRRMFKGP